MSTPTEQVNVLLQELRSAVEGVKQLDAETREKIARIVADMDELRKQQQELALKAQRLPVAGDDPKAEVKAKMAAFLGFVRKGVLGVPAEQKALVEDATGKVLVTEDVFAELFRDLPKLTVVRALASVRPTSKDEVKKRDISEVTVAFGGKLDTLNQFTESTPTPSEGSLWVEDAHGLVKVGPDLLEDSDYNLEEYLRDSFARAFAELEDAKFINGAGHAAGEPEGILANEDVPILVASSTGDDLRANPSKLIDDLIRLSYKVPAQYRRNGVYIVNSDTALVMQLAKDSVGNYLWKESARDGEPARFNGFPVYVQDDVPQLPANGTSAKVAIFGDVRSGYVILDRRQMTVQRLVEKFLPQIGLFATYRVGGGVVRPNALAVLEVPAA